MSSLDTSSLCIVNSLNDKCFYNDHIDRDLSEKINYNGNIVELLGNVINLYLMSDCQI